MHRFLLSLGLLSGLVACSTEPQTSYCEAVCDNAVSCHVDERGADADTLMADCLAATEAADEDCGKATAGELGVATAKLLTKCTDALSGEAGECDAYTGRIDDQKSATTPASCITYNPDAQDTFDVARDATKESGEDLCNRFTDSFCDATAACLSDELGAEKAQQIAEDLGFPSLNDRCLDKMDSQTQSCITDDQYAAEEDLTDVNAGRQAARECLQDFETITCDELFSGQMPALCAGAPEDPTAYAGSLLEIATEFREADQ